ncbi:DegT/DnrJ/EryC1/StrS family aminotransferase [Jiella sonneratiae]|uniref:DegT/DnrJ/EryC1/StrS aminotransferase family protein n=1 Tax=Jiella sonneratiae TaxID=2816856 RepID=A0ABS3IYR0_9HYPH|nr:DegT/DnrJ/EryC1/StrS aminotransferase family protein [Jiella sonneratiae]MBO0902551.1 DegT/DnrJ/EryC1/StrS aminotransferase family protein [Jiella sonneratiae]
MKPFRGSFTQQEPIAEDAIEAAVEVLRSGRLHRYNSVAGETPAAAVLEAAFAAYQGARYCLACASGGYAMAIALRAAGLRPGETVLTNAFTLAPVPGAIAAAGGTPALVEITPDLVVDLDDLAHRFEATGSRFFLLSSMRGHLADMDAVAAVVARFGAVMIEDCAHTMGATWQGRKSGSFGLAGCFSTQTYKHLNAGEGGLLTSDDPEFMARAIILSGSYMLYGRHGAAPEPSVFETIRLETPNMSGRMDNLRAAILVPQLQRLSENIERWNERYRIVASGLAGCEGIVLPKRRDEEGFVGSSIQFLIPNVAPEAARAFVAAAGDLGVDLKWFGADEPVAFTSNHTSWRYMPAQSLPRTDAVLSGLFDMRLPLTFSAADCAEIAAIIRHCHAAVIGGRRR